MSYLLQPYDVRVIRGLHALDLVVKHSHRLRVVLHLREVDLRGSNATVVDAGKD